MSSAGAQCNHVNHVSTQLPYAITVAAVSFVSFIIAGFVQNWLICLPITAFVALKLQLGVWAIGMAIQLECLTKVPLCIWRMNSGKWINDVTRTRS